MYPIIHFSEGFYLPSYLFILSLVYSAGIFWVIRRAQARDLSTASALDYCFAIMVGGFVGARLFHVFWEAPEHYLAQPIDIFKIWQGGFVFFGGVFGAAAFGYGLTKIKKESFLGWADFFAPVFSLGYAVGRLACFFNGCCYGTACDYPWAASFTSHESMGLEVIPRHPTQLYATGFELIVFIALIIIERKRAQPNHSEAAWLHNKGSLFFIWIWGHSFGRLLMEWFRDDYRGTQPLDLSVSSWISLAGLTIASAALLRAYRLSSLSGSQ